MQSPYYHPSVDAPLQVALNYVRLFLTELVVLELHVTNRCSLISHANVWILQYAAPKRLFLVSLTLSVLGKTPTPISGREPQ